MAKTAYEAYEECTRICDAEVSRGMKAYPQHKDIRETARKLAKVIRQRAKEIEDDAE